MEDLEFFYTEIGCGKKLDEVVREWARENDETIPVILFYNLSMLKDWRSVVKRVDSKPLSPDTVFYLWKPQMRVENDLEDQYIELLYEEIGKRRTFDDLV